MKDSNRKRERRIDIRLPPYQYQAITELAREHNAPVSTMIRVLLTKSLDEIIKKEDEQEDYLSDNN
jgi:predicted DNA binding CopG/RHH family protein